MRIIQLIKTMIIRKWELSNNDYKKWELSIKTMIIRKWELSN